MHWCGYFQPVCCKQLVNDRGSNDAVYYFPKAPYTRGHKQPFLTAASVHPAFQPVFPFPLHNTALYIFYHQWLMARSVSFITGFLESESPAVMENEVMGKE